MAPQAISTDAQGLKLVKPTRSSMAESPNDLSISGKEGRPKTSYVRPTF